MTGLERLDKPRGVTVVITRTVTYEIDVNGWALDMDCPATPGDVRQDAEDYLTAEKLIPPGLRCIMRVPPDGKYADETQT